MKRELLLFIILLFLSPIVSQAQGLGSPNSTVTIRGGGKIDSALQIPIWDTSKIYTGKGTSATDGILVINSLDGNLCVLKNGHWVEVGIGGVTSITAGRGLTGGTVTSTGPLGLDTTKNYTWTGTPTFTNGVTYKSSFSGTYTEKAPTFIAGSYTVTAAAAQGVNHSTPHNDGNGQLTWALTDLGTDVSGTLLAANGGIPADTSIAANYTLTSRDERRTIHSTASGAITLTVPALTSTFICTVIQEGAGQVTFSASGTTLTFIPTSTTKTKQLGSMVTIRSWSISSSLTVQGDLQ